MKSVCGDELAGQTAGMVKQVETLGGFCFAMIAALGAFRIGLVLLQEGGCL